MSIISKNQILSQVSKDSDKTLDSDNTEEHCKSFNLVNILKVKSMIRRQAIREQARLLVNCKKANGLYQWKEN